MGAYEHGNPPTGIGDPGEPIIPTATVAYDIAWSGRVSVAIYDVNGRLMGMLFDGFKPAARYEVQWDGTSDSGNSVAGSVYFVRMLVGSASYHRKVVMLK